MGKKVGIDLGTTFSAVAVMDEKTGKPVIVPNTEGGKITPSVIRFTESGEIIVGQEAKEAFEAGEDGCVSAFKRNMGEEEVYCSFYGKDYTAEDLSAIMLKHLKQEAQEVLGEEIEEAVITVPAYFYHKERKATLNAAKMAGLKVRQLINEPTSAAMNYGMNHWRENSRILVYDLGGGTFDVTVVQLKSGYQIDSLQTLGDHKLGGKDWDARIAGLIEENIEEETGISASENIELHRMIQQISEGVKKQLSKANNAPYNCYIQDYGRYSGSVSLEEFDLLTRELREKTGIICNTILENLGVTWNDITDILLVGGSTRMRQISPYLKEISGHMPLSQVNPDEAVALGAAIQVNLPKPKYTVLSMSNPADEPGQEREYNGRKNLSNTKNQFSAGEIGQEEKLRNVLSIRNSDVVAHAMGIIAVNQEGTEYINKTIIPANQQIPVKCAKSFHFFTSRDGDNELEVYVLQGDRKPLESEIIGKYVISGIVHHENENPTTVRIQYSYDLNGMIQVQARQGNNGADLPIRSEAVPEDMSKYGKPVERVKQEPIHVAMAVDVSGSMSGKPMQDALDAMCNFVDKISSYGGGVDIAAIAVSNKCKIVQSLTPNLSLCKMSILSIESCMTGIGNSAHPFKEIKNILQHQSGKRLALVLADGKWYHQAKAVKAARECHSVGIDIVGIGFGDADEQFLRDISSGDIESMLVKQSELSSSFGKIAQEIGANSTGGQQNDIANDQSSATWLAIGE
ncbi:MAG: Hsp70 family protein [Clostridiaceae bacterium]|nr:Hsp70 family protein [Clostridiaceae bacterium]